MHLSAGFSPPTSALEELAGVLASAQRSVEVPHAPPRRFARRRHAVAADPPVYRPVVLDRIPIPRMRVPVAGFGNVTTGDAQRLVAVLTEAATDWPPATLAFCGAAPGEHSKPGTVCVGISGDVEALIRVARGVTHCVERLGFYVDRRRFDPVVEVATANASTEAEDFEVARSALDAFRGQEWVMDALSIFTPSFDGADSRWQELERIPLAGTPREGPASPTSDLTRLEGPPNYRRTGDVGP